MNKDILNEGTPDTVGHGFGVWLLLAEYSPDSTFSFFRAANEKGFLSESDYIEALEDAHLECSVDVLNVSVGLEMDSCEHTESSDGESSECVVCRRTRQAVEDGIVVVAAAGNDPPYNSICCPASDKRVIAVGGYEVICPVMGTNSILDVDSRPPVGPYFVNKWDEEDRNNSLKGTEIYCSQQGCQLDDSCQGNLERSWDGNVQMTEEKPDILAPVQYPTSDGTSCHITCGTSFATPVVAGTLAELLSLCRDLGASFSPDEVKRALKLSSREIEDSDVPILHGTSLVYELCRMTDKLDINEVGGRMRR